MITEVITRNGFREDVYIRPCIYKSTSAIGVRLHHLDNDLSILAIPFGSYIDAEAGCRVMTSSWRRNADEALPARGKIVGRAQRIRRGVCYHGRRPLERGVGGEPVRHA